MSSTLLDPRVIDASVLTPRQTSTIYLQPAVEGQADTAGTVKINVPTLISRLDQAADAFGPHSKLYLILAALLNRGAGPVIRVASVKGATAPTPAPRQARWEKREAGINVRVRLTDSEVQADLVALSASCANASLVDNKQIAFVGMPTGTTKAALLTAATAITSGGEIPASRTCLVAPGVYDQAGTLRGGSLSAAVVAAEVAKNGNPSNDLDLWDIPQVLATELDAFGLPIFRRKVVSGVPMNDYEDLLQGGVSPLQPSRVAGGVATTHLRTAYTTNTAYDALYTRIIIDQLFVDVRDYLYNGGFFRQGNTEATRGWIAAGVKALLDERRAWLLPVQQADGTYGYKVNAVPSADMRQVIVGYEGIVVRGISTIKVAGNLSIPV